MTSPDVAMVLAAIAGLATGARLIVGIGPQNAMVLRAGFVRAHVRLVVGVCVVANVVLITTGVAGVGSALADHRWLVVTATIAGAAYVIAFGLASARRAFIPSGGSVHASPRPVSPSRRSRRSGRH